ARDYIIKQLRRLDIKVERDDFTAQTPLGPRSMTNIIGKLPGRSEGVILVASHYDTKLFDNFRFVGANDGGSSTGALLEIARVLAHRPVEDRPTVWFVFFDGEEALVRWSRSDSKYGSRHLAKKWHEAGILRRVRALILLDMIGDKELDIKRDAFSTRSLVEIIWRTAARMGYGAYFLSERTFVDDDHEPFLRLGVPAVDIIDFHYGPSNRYWHTAADTLDKVDARSLKIVGDVVIGALPAIEAATATRVRSLGSSAVPTSRGRQGL
ncbi:MAG: M28 family peptidase, partial [Acidobacteria bacterium]